MDKYDLILDLIEHPDRYSSQEIEAILADEEMRGIYNLLCKTGGALYSPKETDVDAEWRKFSRKHFSKISFTRLFRNRAASIAVLICVSLTALAIGAGVAVKIISGRNQMAEKTELVEAEYGAQSLPADTIIIESDIDNPKAPVVFEDETLDTILKSVSSYYGKQLHYEYPESGNLRLYFQWNPELPLAEVIEQLNNFGQINLRLDNSKIIVEKP